jgi:hypothetical protein
MLKNGSYDETVERFVEENLYAQVADELLQGKQLDSLWAKALADCDGNEEKSRAFYIKYRVQSLKDEAILAAAMQRQKARLDEDMQSAVGQDDGARVRTINRALQRLDGAQHRQELKETDVSLFLFLGILCAPYVFAWFTLHDKYRGSTRIVSFGWLALMISIMGYYW